MIAVRVAGRPTSQEATRPTSREAGPSSPVADPLAAAVRALAAAALLELALQRTFYRVGLFLPREGPFRVAYALLTGVGSFAFNLASVLAYLVLGWLAVRAVRAGRRAAGGALGAFGAAALLAALAGGAPGAAVRPLFAAATLALTWPSLRGVAPGARAAGRALGRLGLGAVAAAMLSSAYAGAGTSAGGAPGGVGAQLLGEALVLVAAFLLAAAWVVEGAPRRGVGLSVGATAGAGFLAAWAAAPAVTGILALWTVGLRLFLPVPLYAVALAGYAAAAAGWWTAGFLRGPALSLLLAAGFLLDSTYGQLLALLGLGLLAAGRTAEGS